MSRADEIEEIAALWVLRREEPAWSSDDEEKLDRWLAQSDAHKVAFWRLEHGWNEADRIASIGDAPRPESLPKRGSNWAPLAVAASLALVAFLAVLQSVDFPPARDSVQQAQFATSVGGRKTVNLPDGSRVELNTDTLIKAALGSSGREVWLDRGEAFFNVQKDSRRAFVIHAGLRTIRVLGTKFSIRRETDNLVVAVLEGRVRVDNAAAGGSGQSATLAAGDVATAKGRTLLVTSDSIQTVQDQLAWRSGMLVFNETTLAEAAEQFNRYNDKRLIIAGPKAARTRIGGSFKAGNVEAFARLLQEAYGLDVEIRGNEIVVRG